MTSQQKLIPFLCYAKENTELVREFCNKLKSEGWIDPWFDDEDLLAGQVWEDFVTEAVRESHAVIIFLSDKATKKDGFFQKEMKLALDIAAEKPHGTIFIIPIRIDDCEVPSVLGIFHYINYFGTDEQKAKVYSNLIASLKNRAQGLKIPTYSCQITFNLKTY